MASNSESSRPLLQISEHVPSNFQNCTINIAENNRNARRTGAFFNFFYYRSKEMKLARLEIAGRRDSDFLRFMGKFAFAQGTPLDRKSTRLNSSHVAISYAVFCFKKKK